MTNPQSGDDESGFEVQLIDLDDLVVSSDNVRQRDITADVSELAKSIKLDGLQQPIVVQPKGDKFEILIGQRRYLAFKQLGRTTIPARVVAPRSELEAKILSFSENMQRRDLAPRDKADVCAYLLEQLGTVKAVADRLGVSQPTVYKWVGYAGVPGRLKDYVADGRLSRGEASRIWSSTQDEETASEIAEVLVEERPPRERRNRILTAAEELGDAPVPAILERAERLRDRTEIFFVLTESYARAIALVAEELEKDPSDVAMDATIEWLRSHQVFAG